MSRTSETFFDRICGADGLPYVLAEIGANHNGDLELAKKLIAEAKACGCDGVKFQSWDERIFSRVVYEENRFLNDDYRERTDHDLSSIVSAYTFRKPELTVARDECVRNGIDFASTPFELDQLRELMGLEPPFIKIASMDLNNFDLIRAAAETGLSLVISTGFGTLAEIDDAVRCARAADNDRIVLLHCVSLYPPGDAQVNLRNIPTLAATFGVPVGFSDHTHGIEAPLAAVALGAVFIEKHFTLDKTLPGWDHAISADPAEMRVIATGAKRVAVQLGDTRRNPSIKELERRAAYRRSIITLRAVKAGEPFSMDNLGVRRPGTGLSPALLDVIRQMAAAKDLPAECLLSLGDIRPR